MNPAHAPLYGSQIPQPNPAQSTATSSQTQTTSLGVDAPSFEEACPGLYRLALAYVRERSPAFIGSNSSRAWLPEAPGVTTLARVLDATEEMFAQADSKDEVTPRAASCYDALYNLAVSSGAQELRAATAVIEALHWPEVGEDFAGLHWADAYRSYCNVLLNCAAAGRPDLMTEAIRRARSWAFAPAAEIPDHLLSRERFCSTPPICPAMRPVGLLEGTRSVDALLPEGLARTLRSNWRQIAEEAQQLTWETRGDAYSEIARAQRWQRVVLFESFENGTVSWDEEECGHVPFTCSTLRGRLPSEQEELRSSQSYAAESVQFFRLAAGESVPPHTGQSWQLNVHLCVLHCEGSALVFGGWSGSKQPYTAGNLLAFDDDIVHAVANEGPHDRVVLALGVTHPAFEHGLHTICDGVTVVRR